MAGDEISLSVEETNELRRKLGLKPLKERVLHSMTSWSKLPADCATESKKAEESGNDETKFATILTSGGGILDADKGSSTLDWLASMKNRKRSRSRSFSDSLASGGVVSSQNSSSSSSSSDTSDSD